MICPNCKAKISELDEKCPVCGIVLNDYESEKKLDDNNKESTSIVIAKRIIIGILLINTIIMFCIKSTYIAIACILLAIGTWISLTIEEKKINLLQAIYEKIK